MKKILLLCAGLVLLEYLPGSLARAQLYRPIIETNEITAMNPWDAPLWWKQGESIRYDVYARAGGHAFDLGTNSWPVWVVGDYSNRAIWRVATTGTVINATNGHVRCTLTPGESNIGATQYWSEVRIYEVDASTNRWIATIADKLAYVYEGNQAGDLQPAIDFPVAFDVTINQYGSGGTIETDPVWSAISGTITAQAAQGVTAYGWGDHSAAGYATGTPLYVYTETDPAWQAGTGAIWTAINAGGVTASVSQLIAGSGITLDPTSGVGAVTIAASGGGGGMDPAVASNSFVDVAGDTMTGLLQISAVKTQLCLTAPVAAYTDDTNIMTISTGNIGIGIGFNTVSTPYTATDPYGFGVAVGYAANALYQAAAFGTFADGNNLGAAFGHRANAGQRAIAVGRSANGYNYGAAAGSYANASKYGSAVGHYANAYNYGSAVGQYANASPGGVAIGSLANAYGGGNNVALGYGANCSGKTNCIALGSTTNIIGNTIRIRGSLYLDGATTLVFRSTFGSGDWSVGLQTETGRLYSINSEGTRTLISPHDPATGESILQSENPYAGERVTINLERMAAALEAMGHTGLIERTAITRRDWDAEQADRAAARLDEIAAWDKARADAIKAADAWDATPAKDRDGQERPSIPELSARPSEYVPHPCPDWISKKQKEK